MSKTTHTPTPWEAESDSVWHEDFGRVALLAAPHHPDGEKIASANAAHVVKCVNSHDALVEALEHVMAMHDDAYLRDHEEWAHIVADARTALAKAKATERVAA